MVKYNLILDLDETILQSVNFPTWYYDESSRHMFPLVGISMPLLVNKKEILKKPSTHPDIRQVFFRPYLINFLEFCFKHFNVTIWTNSVKEYCEPILDYLEIKDKCKHIFIRKPKKGTKDYYSISPNNNLHKTHTQLYEYQEVRTGKILKLGMNYRAIFKPVNLLWQHTDFKKTYTQNNTVIIDDLAEMYVQYPENTILIPGWCHLNWKDDNLKIIIDKLESYFSNKKRKNIKDMCQKINKTFQRDMWQELSSYDCQYTDFKPEFYYKKSITKKNQNLLLKKEKVGNQKNYDRKTRKSNKRKSKRKHK
jgi:hypothetical protein